MKQTNQILFTILLFLVFLIPGCAPTNKPEVTPQQVIEYNNITREADNLYSRGCYIPLKQAFGLYEQALTYPVFPKKTAEKLLKTAILLGLRERELGILDEKYFLEADKIIAASPHLADYSMLLKIASTVPRKTVGVVGDIIEDGKRVIVPFDEVKADLENWTKFLMQKSGSEDIYDYLKIGFFSSFSYLIKIKLHTESIEKAYPGSPIIGYRLAILPEGDPEDLERLTEADPEFYEAFYFLGQKAFSQRMLVTAEKNFLKAYQGISESSSLIISLASIYFAFEELEKSLEFYEKALGMASGYRDVLLGKAMCLSYLGKHPDAIEICKNLISLGKYYMGESHYWLAWNQNELGQWDNAWKNIELSKNYLIGHGEVSYLAGLIAFNQKRLEEAEKNLLEANKQDDSNGDPSYYLGKIKNIQADWLNSGAYFELASRRYGINEEIILKRIDAIKNSAFTEDRKKKHLAKKTSQLRKIQLTKATAWYNAAAGFFNAGYPDKALQLAEKAASHSALKEKAEDLISMMKK